jgi:hypothetical protein
VVPGPLNGLQKSLVSSFLTIHPPSCILLNAKSVVSSSPHKCSWTLVNGKDARQWSVLAHLVGGSNRLDFGRHGSEKGQKHVGIGVVGLYNSR